MRKSCSARYKNLRVVAPASYLTRHCPTYCTNMSTNAGDNITTPPPSVSPQIIVVFHRPDRMLSYDTDKFYYKDTTTQFAFMRSHFDGKTKDVRGFLSRISIRWTDVFWDRYHLVQEIYRELIDLDPWSLRKWAGPHLKATFKNASYNEDTTPTRVTKACWASLYPRMTALHIEYKRKRVCRSRLDTVVIVSLLLTRHGLLQPCKHRVDSGDTDPYCAKGGNSRPSLVTYRPVDDRTRSRFTSIQSKS